MQQQVFQLELIIEMRNESQTNKMKQRKKKQTNFIELLKDMLY